LAGESGLQARPPLFNENSLLSLGQTITNLPLSPYSKISQQ
jgi:hypothetical protein